MNVVGSVGNRCFP